MTGEDISWYASKGGNIGVFTQSLRPDYNEFCFLDQGGPVSAEDVHRQRVIMCKLTWRKLGLGVGVKFVSPNGDISAIKPEDILPRIQPYVVPPVATLEQDYEQCGMAPKV